LADPTFQESHWLEWKSSVDLGERGWQARVARFILGAANRPHEVASSIQNGAAFMVLGVEPGRAVGTPRVDPATVQAGLKRFLGGTGPAYLLDYVALEDTTVAVVTVQPVRAGSRPYLARGTFSAEKVVLQDGRIYVRRTGATEEATASEVDDMLAERLAARRAAGGRGWPAEPVVDAWRVGRTIYLRRERGDQLVIEEPDNFTNLGEMARDHPPLPWPVDPLIAERVSSIFGPLLALADSDPKHAVEEAWQPLRNITLEVHAQLLGTPPRPKVIDIVAELATAGHVAPGWVDVAYPLYYWSIDREEEGVRVGEAKTYLHLAEHLATALLHARDDRSQGSPPRGNSPNDSPGGTRTTGDDCLSTMTPPPPEEPGTRPDDTGAGTLGSPDAR
jgi:hypothetical protein